MNAHRLYAASKRKRQVCRNRWLLVLTAAVAAAFISILAGSRLVSAHGSSEEEPVDYKYYKSIEVEEGDSLWRIAETFMNDEYDSITSYIEEIKTMNQLESDHIQEGQYLTVAYYDTEFK